MAGVNSQSQESYAPLGCGAGRPLGACHGMAAPPPATHKSEIQARTRTERDGTPEFEVGLCGGRMGGHLVFAGVVAVGLAAGLVSAYAQHSLTQREGEHPQAGQLQHHAPEGGRGMHQRWVGVIELPGVVSETWRLNPASFQPASSPAGVFQNEFLKPDSTWFTGNGSCL